MNGNDRPMAEAPEPIPISELFYFTRGEDSRRPSASFLLTRGREHVQ